MFLKLPKELKDDQETALAAVKQNGSALKYASNRLKDDEEIILTAVKKNPYVFKYISKKVTVAGEIINSNDYNLIYYLSEYYSFSLDKQNALLENFPGYEKFVEKIKEINEKANEYQKINFYGLMNKNTWNLFFLHKIMGKEVFTFCQSFVAHTLLSLQRFLEGIDFPLVDSESISKYLNSIRKYYEKYKKDINTQEGRKVWKNILQGLSFIFKIKYDSDSDLSLNVDSFFAELNRFSLEKAKKFIDNKLAEKVITILRLESSQSIIDIIKFKLLGEKKQLFILQLLQAKQKMKNQPLESLFKEILRAAFTSKDSNKVYKLLHNPDQKSKLGKKVALHNQMIRKELQKNGINVEQAFNHNKSYKVEFNFAGDKIDYSQQRRTLWNEIFLLSTLLNGEENYTTLCRLCGKNKKKLTQLKRYLNKIITDVNKETPPSQDITPEELESFWESRHNLINTKIQSTITGLQKRFSLTANKTINKTIINSFNERTKHFLDRLRETNALKPKKRMKNGSFRIELWDKSKLSMLNLGNHVDCCLATNGTRFSTTIERMLDDAMPIPVVIDESSGLPVALAWVFLAKEKDKSGVSLVANYFEIKSKFGLYEKSRDFIINNLLRFIGDYSTEIGAKRFLINRLTYGNIPDFKQFKSIETNLEKVGGFFSPSDDKYEYYLDSLNKREFHLYEEGELNLTNKIKITEKAQSQSKRLENKSTFFSIKCGKNKIIPESDNLRNKGSSGRAPLM